MKSISKKKKILFGLIILVLILILAFGIYRNSKIKLFDKSAYSTLYKNIEASADSFRSQEDLRNFISSWAEEKKLDYTVDSAQNIIFSQKAISRKKKLSPTVVVVNYNYENVVDNKKVLASAAMIASTKINSGKTTVIFVNNENNDGTAYYNLSQSYFPKNAKVIYLDYGKHMYVSNKSFASAVQTVSIPSKKTDVKCDTAIKIKIKGLKSDCVDTSINNKVNPISLLSTVLTRLKSKSTIAQIANIKVHNKGNMYADSLEATILINSYSLESFTKYLDKRIEAFDKACDDENCKYSYRVMKEKNMPETAYSKETFNSLATLLFTIKNGTIRFDEDSVIPEDYEIDDINSIICPTQLRVENGNIYLDIYSQAVNSDYLNEALIDNSTAAKLSNCEINSTSKTAPFVNKDKKLINILKRTYVKVSDIYGSDFLLNLDADTYFTPMSYLKEINPSMNIVHIKENSKSASTLTNMILCYIQTKGNFLSL